jgi:hypothetical protein
LNCFGKLHAYYKWVSMMHWSLLLQPIATHDSPHNAPLFSTNRNACDRIVVKMNKLKEHWIYCGRLTTYSLLLYTLGITYNTVTNNHF